MDSSGSPIVVVGSLNADLVIRVPHFPRAGETLTGHGFARFAGGKGANQACAAARLGAGAAMVGQVGADEHGAWLAAQLVESGVHTRFVLRDEAAATGVALITIDAAGQNQIVLVPGANGTFTPERLALVAAPLRDARVLLLQLEIPLETVRAAARAGRARRSDRDSRSGAGAGRCLTHLLSLCDYVTPNETELATLTGGGEVFDADDVRRRAGQLLGRKAARVLVKWGARGAALFTAGSEYWWPAHQLEVVDTTAAGDAFNGAFAVALAGGAAEEAAGRFANAVGALAVTRAGAQPAMPLRADVERLLDRFVI